MIVDCAVYDQGKRRPGVLELDHALEACRADGAFVWVGLYEPDEAEFDAVRAEFVLHELAVEDAVAAHQRPKLEVYEGMLLMVLKSVRYDDAAEEIDVGEIIVFVADDFLITVRHGSASPLHDVRERMERRPQLLAHGPAAALHAIVDRVVDDYEPAVLGVDHDISEVEAQVFSGGDGAQVGGRIFRLEREVLEFQRAVVPLSAPLAQLARGHFPHVPDELHDYFRDVHDHLLRVTAQIDGHRQLLSSVLQANLAQLTYRQNEDVRRISAWAAILAVPTAVAGIYGMNFEHMPELDSPAAYPVVIALIAVVCLYLHHRLRRAGWL